MASIKEIAKAAKSKIKSSKKLKDDILDIVKDTLGINCSLLLDVFLKFFKFDNDLHDLNDELHELTPNLYFRINDNSKEYGKEIEECWSEENPELLTDGIVLGDIYYRRKDLLHKASHKAVATAEEGIVSEVVRQTANIVADQDWYESLIIRISAHPKGVIDVNDIVNHIKIFSEMNKKELAKLIAKTTFTWTMYSMKDWIGSKPKKKINKFKNYKDMMTNLTNFLVEDVSKEGAIIDKYFSKGLFGLVHNVLGFAKKEIGFAESLVYFDKLGNEIDI